MNINEPWSLHFSAAAYDTQGHFPKKWLLATPQNCVVETFLMWACFWHSLEDFKVGVAHPRGEIGRLSASPSFGTLIKCVGGQVEWAGPAGNQNCSEFASWTLLASI